MRSAYLSQISPTWNEMHMRERHLIASFAIIRSILLDHYWFEDCIVLIEMLIETVDWIKIGNWEEFASRESEKECDDDDGIVAPLAAIPYLSILPFIFRIKRERERELIGAACPSIWSGNKLPIQIKLTCDFRLLISAHRRYKRRFALSQRFQFGRFYGFDLVLDYFSEFPFAVQSHCFFVHVALLSSYNR